MEIVLVASALFGGLVVGAIAAMVAITVQGKVAAGRARAEAWRELVLELLGEDR